MNHLNFSWVIDGKLAGHQAASSDRDLLQGILSLVRLVEDHEPQVTSLQISQQEVSVATALMFQMEP
ncbi:MAG: hypothetical protein Q7R50_06205 [Dehalococcoidales bacterium]|nr:hypothetical protein [Dehalococcoidales bacterium]